MELDLRLGEKLLTPLRETQRGFLELLIQNLVRLSASHPLGPSLRDHLIETRQGHPEVFKLEGPRSPRPSVVGEQQRAVIGKG